MEKKEQNLLSVNEERMSVKLQAVTTVQFFLLLICFQIPNVMGQW